MTLTDREQRVASKELGVTRCAIKNNVVSLLNKTGLELALWWIIREG